MNGAALVLWLAVCGPGLVADGSGLGIRGSGLELTHAATGSVHAAERPGHAAPDGPRPVADGPGHAPAGPQDASALFRARETAEFASRARAATERYHDRDAAAADGYRLIGGDFPGMGEHWIQTDLVFDGAYDPERPEFLAYVAIDGTPRLIGVAYAVPLLEGEQPPEEPAGREAWHAHTGSLDDETLAPHHHHSSHAEHGPRLAMVHAWVWLDNPEGMFAADNWSIPFLRLGLGPPREAAPAAGKALSLLSGGATYVERVVRAAAAEELVDDGALAAAIAAATARAREVVEGLEGARLSTAPREARAVAESREDPRLPPEKLERLAAAWARMWAEIEALLSAEAVARLSSQAMR